MMDDLWQNAIVAIEKGDFSRLETMLGGPVEFDEKIVDWHKAGKFDDEPRALEEAFACACFLGRTSVAEYLLDKGVDPVAGNKSGQTGFHYAVSGGHLYTIRLLIERKVPMEIENMYGGTVLGQALWSAVNEHKPNHAEIIEALINAGADVGSGTIEWWETQNVPFTETKSRVAYALRQHDMLDDPLKLAHKIRHLGLAHENKGRLKEAEKYYDKALTLYRKHETGQTLDYANAVRYTAVIKERLCKDEESIWLWEEAHDRYVSVGTVEGIAEAAAWLTLLYHRKSEVERCREWFARASAASKASINHDTHKFIAEVKIKIGAVK